MRFSVKRLLLKSKLYAPIGFAIIISILIITVQAVYNLKRSIYSSIEKNLSVEIETVIKMFERERNIKLANVKTYLKVADDYFYSKSFAIKKDSIQVKVISQITGASHYTWIKKWEIDGNSIDRNHSFIDKIADLTGSTVTIFQKIDSGYVRMSTNVLNNDHERALNTYISNNSPVVQQIEKGNKYFGRAYVVNDWYISAYEPVIINGKTVGMLYVGCKEKDLSEFKKTLSQIKIGKSGMMLIFDESGNVIISKQYEGENWKDKKIFEHILKNKRGITKIIDEQNGKEKILAFDYFDDFKLYLAASVYPEDETKTLIKDIVSQSFMYGTIIFVLLSIFVYFITTENLHTYLKQLEISNKKLSFTREALEHSENKFRTLFNNSSDEVFVSDYQGRFVELNQVACDTLEYTREELLKKRFFDIKTKKYRPYVSQNIKKIIAQGYHTYDTEHVSKSGKVYPFEMKSKIIEYEGRHLILSIARNISDRKAMEKQIVQTIIETEMNERKRFSADLHDGLGPVLSAIRLYSDLIKRGNFNKMSLEEAVSNIDELVDMAISNTKEISNNITPNVLEDFGLSVAIQEFCSFISRTKSIAIDLSTNNFTITKPGIETTILYQTVKELINNTLKHAQAQNIRIELKNYNDQVILYYRDDGQGFNVDEKLNQRNGLGLHNIINKIKMLKGNCDFNSAEGKGMFVLINLNLENEQS